MLDLRFKCQQYLPSHCFHSVPRFSRNLTPRHPRGSVLIRYLYSIVQYKEMLDLYNYIFTVNVCLFRKKARNWVVCSLIKTKVYNGLRLRSFKREGEGLWKKCIDNLLAKRWITCPRSCEINKSYSNHLNKIKQDIMMPRDWELRIHITNSLL